MEQITVFTDGSVYKKNPSSKAASAFIIKKNNETIYQYCQIYNTLAPILTSNEVEYRAVEIALVHLIENKLQHIETTVNSDSQLVVQQLQDNWVCNHSLLKLIRDHIWQLMDQFKSIHVRWIPREENTEADVLSKSLWGN